MKTGILALQGDFEAHARMLDKLHTSWQYVRQPLDLEGIHNIIIPGGESSTLLYLLQQTALFDILRAYVKKGVPFFGTCAGAILLAKTVYSPEQPSLEAVDVSVQRNAYGRQLKSHIAYGYSILKREPMEMFFIRAPQLSALSPEVIVLAEYEGTPVCVQQNTCLLATFHPELTADTTLHSHFLKMAKHASIQV